MSQTKAGFPDITEVGAMLKFPSEGYDTSLKTQHLTMLLMCLIFRVDQRAAWPEHSGSLGRKEKAPHSPQNLLGTRSLLRMLRSLSDPRPKKHSALQPEGSDSRQREADHLAKVLLGGTWAINIQ